MDMPVVVKRATLTPSQNTETLVLTSSKHIHIYVACKKEKTASVLYWSEFLLILLRASVLRVPGMPRITNFLNKQFLTPEDGRLRPKHLVFKRIL
jgi:hypothetical protein